MDHVLYPCFEYIQFAAVWDFKRTASLPLYPQSNGLVEENCKTIKNILRKCKDLSLVLLIHQTIPSNHGFSPAEMLMGRKLRNTHQGLQKYQHKCKPQRKGQTDRGEKILFQQTKHKRTGIIKTRRPSSNTRPYKEKMEWYRHCKNWSNTTLIHGIDKL